MANCEGCPMVALCDQNRQQVAAEEARLAELDISSLKGKILLEDAIDELPLRTTNTTDATSHEIAKSLDSLAEIAHTEKKTALQMRAIVFDSLRTSLLDGCTQGTALVEGNPQCRSRNKNVVFRRIQEVTPTKPVT